MTRRLLPLAVLAGVLTGCGAAEPKADQAEPQTDVEAAPTPGTDVAVSEYQTSACGRDAQGQVACLVAAFDTDQCDDAVILGSFFKDNEKTETHEYRTAYGVKNDCVETLREGALRRGLRANERGEFVGELEDGYRETLIIGLQVSTDGTVIEWERIKQ
ncbi:MAG: hypothetical protein WBA51_05410 [Erythrobacter sp.]